MRGRDGIVSRASCGRPLLNSWENENGRSPATAGVTGPTSSATTASAGPQSWVRCMRHSYPAADRPSAAGSVVGVLLRVVDRLLRRRRVRSARRPLDGLVLLGPERRCDLVRQSHRVLLWLGGPGTQRATSQRTPIRAEQEGQAPQPWPR